MTSSHILAVALASALSSSFAAAGPSAAATPSASAPLFTASLTASPAPTAATPQSGKKKKKAPKGYHVNARYGFQFKKPKKWSNIALKVEEEWLAAKYISDTEYAAYSKVFERTYNHKPELQVIAFPLAAMKKKTEVKKSKDGDKATIIINNPYKDYEDYLARTFKGGGYYKSEEEEAEVDGVRVTKMTFLVEKLAANGPQTISTWIYHSEDVDYAVQIMGLTKHFKKISKSFKPVRQTFKLIEREGPINITGATSDRVTYSRISSKVTDKKERKSEAVASEKVMHERAIAKLPPEGWNHKTDGRVLTVFSADKKYAGRVQDHANNLFDWLDDEFGFLGPDAYLRHPIVRICKDGEEAGAYLAGVNSGTSGGRIKIEEELVTWWDSGGWTGYAIDRLNEQIYGYWMLEKNFALSTSMPQWIDVGLEYMVQNVRMDSKKPNWRPIDNVKNQVREAIRKDKFIPLKELFLSTTEEIIDAAKEAKINPGAEAAWVINYLAQPNMKRHRLGKGLLEKYLRNMVKVVDEVEKEQKRKLDSARSAANKGDGEREYIERRRQIFREMEKELLKRVFDLTFADFDDKDWADLNKACMEAL